MSTRTSLVRERVSILRPGFFGPSNRRSPAETCVCGVQFTTYWSHRETAHHKRFMRTERQAKRAKKEARNSTGP